MSVLVLMVESCNVRLLSLGMGTSIGMKDACVRYKCSRLFRKSEARNGMGSVGSRNESLRLEMTGLSLRSRARSPR